MTPEESRAYSRGYQAGSKGRYPKHLPPSPPDEVAAAIYEALTELRSRADAELATFPDDDEIRDAFEPALDKADAAIEAYAAWLCAPGLGSSCED